MEGEERPAKVVKLEHNAGNEEAKFAPQTAIHNGSETLVENGTSQNSKPRALESEPQPDQNLKDEQASAEDADTGVTPEDAAAKPLSKSALKKLKRKQEWEEGREERKAKRKDRIKASKERKREEIRARLADQPENGDVLNGPSPAPQKKHNVRAKQLPITFLFDCNFDDLMLENELVSLAGQLTRCYADNKKARFRAHLAVASFGGNLRERFDTVLAKNYESWRGVRFFSEDFVEVSEKAKGWMRESKHGGQLAGVFERYNAKKAGGAAEDASKTDDAPETEIKAQDTGESGEEGEVIYLTAESEETLEELKPYSTYIIGGLVDKNRHKGICFKRAMERGVKTAKLPIGQFLQMNSRSVLATNHVSELMLKWLELGDWGEAFMQVLPKRKGATLKGNKEAAGGSVNDDGSDEESVNEVDHPILPVTAEAGDEENMEDTGAAVEATTEET